MSECNWYEFIRLAVERDTALFVLGIALLRLRTALEGQLDK